MMGEFVEWFEAEVGENKGIVDCVRILERAGATTPGPEIGGPIVLKAYMKAVSILEARGI